MEIKKFLNIEKEFIMASRQRSSINNIQSQQKTILLKRNEYNMKDKVIYECYLPQTIKDARDYTQFILKNRSIIPNEVEEYNQETEETDPLALSPNFDFDPEKQVIETENISIKSYFEEYVKRSKGTLNIHSVDRP